MKKDDIINITLLVFIHTVLSLVALYSMFLWIGAFPYVSSGNTESGIVYILNRESFSAIQIAGTISLAINLVCAFVSKFTCRTFMIIHLVLAEFCLAQTIMLFFV
ncbi:MAG: hypothetical protein J6E38_00835 [Clostridia bacterium]|nr:hypothetical protein [Clostridia bacterium]